MSFKTFLLFHHNLAFSSIEEECRIDVIRQCYMPLLEIPRRLGIPINIEMPAWTLEKCCEICPEYVEELKLLIDDGKVTIVASGYTQMIGPLVPYEVNLYNHLYGLKQYEKLLGVRPKIVLVNEMAYSSGLLDVYDSAGYSLILMDQDNFVKATGLKSKAQIQKFQRLSNNRDTSIPVIWTDSIVFQKFQRVVHSQIDIPEYVEWITEVIKDFSQPFPLYCNDVEVFNYRPGRFKDETAVEVDEWERIFKVLTVLTENLDLEFICLAEDLVGGDGLDLTLSSASSPVAVKKQQKYNIARWAVSGRADGWLNTECFKLFRRFQETIDFSDLSPNSPLVKLCYFWSSDFRTHITQKRWEKLCGELSEFKDLIFDGSSDTIVTGNSSLAATNTRHRLNYENTNDRIKFESSHLSCTLNLRKGAAIEKLSFLDNSSPSIVSYPHGYFSDIDFSADFCSGGVVIEDFNSRLRFADYAYVKPEVDVAEDQLHIRVSSSLGQVQIEKEFSLSASDKVLTIRFRIHNPGDSVATVRIGNFLIPQHEGPASVAANTGGKGCDTFLVEGDFDHTDTVNRFISSASGFCCPDGYLAYNSKGSSVIFEWDNSECFLFPMMQHLDVGEKKFTRLLFSCSEVDDTRKSARGDTFQSTIRIRGAVL